MGASGYGTGIIADLNKATISQNALEVTPTDEMVKAGFIFVNDFERHIEFLRREREKIDGAIRELENRAKAISASANVVNAR